MAIRKVKIIVTVPLTHADAVREVIGKAGAGKLGNYSFCSFSVRGTGRFLPNGKSNPTIGKQGKLESIDEERIEVTCDRILFKDIIAAVKKVHPYEEIALDVYPLEEI